MNEEHQALLKLTESLSIYGWGHLDAVILASLATNSPMLLIGGHGTAKTLLVERMAKALNLDFRHYNVSLINYDDLVGIPIPNESDSSLRFIGTEGAIWGAEFAFFDEISRCRPDLQNKLFPLIHERKIVGLPLKKLKHRWAAMNPPLPDSATMDLSQPIYLGSESLDMALLDRFPFILTIPSWRDMTVDDRVKVLVNSQFLQDDFNLSLYVEECHAYIPQVREMFQGLVCGYVVPLMDALEKAQLPQSPRRARMLMESILAIHAARCVLMNEEANIEESILMGLLYGIPQSATDTPPSVLKLTSIHKQVWEMITHMEDDNWRRVLSVNSDIERILLADDMGFSDDDLSKLITQALGNEANQARKISLATAIYLAFSSHRILNPAAWEILVKLAGCVLIPHQIQRSLIHTDIAILNELKAYTESLSGSPELVLLVSNYLLGSAPDLWRNNDWKISSQQFIQDLQTFSVIGKSDV
jgi:MoxR-like ATPase